MSRRTQRRRAIVLLSLALATGGLAASEVQDRVHAVEERVGPLVPVVVADADLEGGTKLAARVVRRHLAVRHVPERFVPPDSFAAPREVVGLELSSPLVRGGYLTAGHLAGGSQASRGAGGLAAGERAVEVAIAAAPALPGMDVPGARVDVLVTTSPRTGPGRTYVALQGVELLALRSVAGGLDRAAPGDGATARAPEAMATLRVTARQAVYLTAAENFAQEVRLLARAPGDRIRVDAAAVEAGGL